MKLVVGIATVGRPELAARVVERLKLQTRPPDGVVVVGGAHADVAAVRGFAGLIVATVPERGLCRQRNRVLDLVKGRADLLVFFDDDFIPCADYLERAEALFAREADVVGATGRIIADGIKSPGLDFAEAVRRAEGDRPPPDAAEHPAEALYGCNMALRLSAMRGLRFDEQLPLYGWLEDIDLTYRLARRGRLIRSHLFGGVHMGAKAGRTPGLKLGYSQIANPLYLLGKNSAPPRLARQMIARNLASNLVRSLWPEPHVDRRGRLKGNALALWHLATGRLRPEHVLMLR